MKRKQSGFTILEMIVVLMVMVAAISAGSAYMKKNADNNLNQTAAANLQKLAQAVKWYAKDNYATLKSAGETTLSIADLIDNKYLEEGFSKVNSYGQRYTISIQPDAKNSELLQLRIITENGSVI
ncbi:shufflon system plasmid conjugative transfer pilus tip adhesin PilV, partial [Enterobacteriaceae bacterium H18W14]